MSTMIPLSLLISLDDDGTTKIFLQWHTTRIWGKGNKRKAQENKNYRQFFIDFPTRRHDDVHFYWIMKQRRKKVMSWWWERERDDLREVKKVQWWTLISLLLLILFPFRRWFSALHLSSFSFTCTIFILRHIFLL